MKIVVISDTHGDLGKIQVPPGDLLLHCGDLSSNGSRRAIAEFNDELGALPHKYKVVIAGNHDEFLETDPVEGRKLFSNAIYLQDEEVVIEGIRIYGSPWSPKVGSWSFSLPRYSEKLASKWMCIPGDTDILMTHCPPRDILDRNDREPLGCDYLRYFIDQGYFAPALHCFGHIHQSYGGKRLGRTFYANASYAGRNNAPIVLDWDELKAQRQAVQADS